MASTNKNAHIRTRIDRTGKVRTETHRRDPGTLDVAITTNPRTNSTRVFFDTLGCGEDGLADLELNGRELRTIIIMIQNHLDALNGPC